MMMIDYGSEYTGAGSTLGSDTLSGSMSSRQPTRVRTVRLVRPNHAALPPPGLTCRHGPSLGFSIRGGREHGTGFFVSQVDLGSEAHRQGLKIGDQIIRINGFTIEDAVHKEILQLISNHTHLTLKVRSVGMIPVKDKRTDPLSWQIISDCYNSSSTRSSPQLTEKNHDIRINIIVAPRSKLGCGICKGPDWKPGIFIQFTKEGGIAREAGLRPGDQILYCNNVDFGDITFNEAVHIMKTSRQLDLIVRKSAGSELFPGESSGYNSSASSVTGDQSPSWSDSKRLSIVKEESLDLEDRLSHFERFNKCKKWEKIEWDDTDNDSSSSPESKYHFKPTIINLSENGTTIKNNGSVEEFTEIQHKLANLCKSSMSDQRQTKTVVVEVHRTAATTLDSIEDKLKTEHNLVKSPSCSSFASSVAYSSTSSTAASTTSLSSAISQELLRRTEKNRNSSKPTIDEQLQMKKVLHAVDCGKQQQHTQLMDEFRKAHRKMFKAGDIPSSNVSANASQIQDTLDRNINREFNEKVTERLANLSKETIQEKSTTYCRASTATVLPPPPPPLPAVGESVQKTHDSSTDILKQHQTQSVPKKQKAPPPPVPIKTSTLSSSYAYQYLQHHPPPCPTPDYDTLSINSNSTIPRNCLKKKQPLMQTLSSHSDTGGAVDMDSLESFRINNPSNNGKPKPPNTYFQKQLTHQTSADKQRPVSVTIGEYPSGTSRKLPSKFEFLQIDTTDNGGATSQFANELAQTLSRSNLRKQTETMIQQNECNGSVRISVNNNLNKSNNKAAHTFEDIARVLENRVTINIASNEDKKTDTTATPNGILKNASTNNAEGNHSFTAHRPVVHQKSITFGEMPTVIKEIPAQHVT